MAGIRVKLDPSRSTVVVRGRATGHGFQTRFDRVEGDLSGEPAGLDSTAAARIAVAMDSFTCGDVIRDFKTRRYLDPRRHPEASFELDGVVVDDGAAVESALAEGREIELGVRGRIRYRGRSAAVEARARGRVAPDGAFEATCTFGLDIRDLGLEPPRFLFLRVSPEVEVEAELRGTVVS